MRYYFSLEFLAGLHRFFGQDDQDDIEEGKVDIGEEGSDGFHAIWEGDADPLSHLGSDPDAVDIIFTLEIVSAQGGVYDQLFAILLKRIDG